MTLDFWTLFKRQLLIDGGVYLIAPDEKLHDMLFEIAKNRGLQVQREDVPVMSSKTLMDPAHRVRMKGYRDAMESKLAASGASAPAHLFCNLVQTVGHCGINVTQSLAPWPTLMRTSWLADIGAAAGHRGRPVHPLEHYYAMGFAPHASGCGPFGEALLRELSMSDMRHLTGNGMHVVAVGTWMQYILAVIKPAGAQMTD